VSHFTRVRTKIVDGDVLAEALGNLDVSFERGAVTIGGYLGGTHKAEFRIPTKAKGYDLGFVASGGTYDLIADWWGVRGVDRDSFVTDVSRAYATIATRRSFEAQGFTVAHETTETDGAVRLVLRRMT